MAKNKKNVKRKRSVTMGTDLFHQKKKTDVAAKADDNSADAAPLKAAKKSSVAAGDQQHIVDPGVRVAWARQPYETPKEALEWILYPVPLKTFFSEYWEKKPLLIKRKNPTYYEDLFSTAILDDILHENPIKFTENIDITTYENHTRETINPVGRAKAAAVWDMFKNQNASVRMLNPQSYHKPLWKLMERLQQYFGCMVGANTYLTPKDAQGFAPHYDDIEAFLLQIEGTKYWRLYENPSGEQLPRFSSGNFKPSEIGSMFMEGTLEPGDMLYFPRGCVHQGVSQPDKHSLHVTVSAYQLNSWGRLLEHLVPRALESAQMEDVQYREGLPRNFIKYMGISKTEQDAKKREMFTLKTKQLFKKLWEYASVDAAADKMALDYIHDCMPPYLSEEEKEASVHACNFETREEEIIQGDTRLRLTRSHGQRLVADGDTAVVYHLHENSMVYHAEDPVSLDFPLELAEPLEFVLNSKAPFVVSELPNTCADVTPVELAQSLFEAGIVILDK